MANAALKTDDLVPITGRRLALPPGPIFHLQRAADAVHELGEFRAWAGYKNLGSDTATDGLVQFQQVVSFADTKAAGRTGVHGHFAHAHIVIPTSGRGVFSYDGVTTEAVPGVIIHQHAGTIHDQFDYSYVPAPQEETRRTPVSLEPVPAGAAAQSFGFLELFVPKHFANVEIIPPAEVTAEDQRTAWDHPYHAPGASFRLQGAGEPSAAYRPVAGAPGLEARDGATWGPSGRLVATWVLRASVGGSDWPPISLGIAGEEGGLDIFYVASGSLTLPRTDGGASVVLAAGDTLTVSAGVVGLPAAWTKDLSLLRFFVSGRAEALRERTPAEIARLEALGPAIITGRRVRAESDDSAVNALHES
jgi:quercetin dioxygenase-like cupin family protein